MHDEDQKQKDSFDRQNELLEVPVTYQERKTMKTFVYFVIVTCVVFSVGCQPQAKPPLTQAERAAIEKAVLQKHSEMISDIEQLDIDKFYSSILDNGKGTIIRNGQVLTRTEALNSSKKSFAGLQKLEYEFDEKYVKVISPETAIVIVMAGLLQQQKRGSHSPQSLP